MRRFLLEILPCVFILAGFGCGKATVYSDSAPPSNAPPVPVRTPYRDAYEFKYAEDFLTDADTLARGDYRIVKLEKPIVFDGRRYDDAAHEYAGVERAGRRAATFDVLVHPLGTSVRFGSIALFPGAGEQFLVEQTAHRDDHYWVFDPETGRIIFGGEDYHVGKGFRTIDIDRDGTAEIVCASGAFWFFDRLSSVDSPFIDVVFRYDARKRRYVPANRRFADFVMRATKEKIEVADPIFCAEQKN